jgi:hypothetical protein
VWDRVSWKSVSTRTQNREKGGSYR